MAFNRDLLHEQEEMVLDLKPHWWFMAESTAALIGAIVVGAILVWANVEDKINGGLGQVLTYLTILAIVVALGWFALRYLKWITTNFVLTSDRLIFRVGVISKRGIEIPLERINTVFFHQSILERMLGAGDLALESGGETGKQEFSDIRKPNQVQNEIYRQMELNNNRMYHGDPEATAAAAAVAAAEVAQQQPVPLAASTAPSQTIPQQIAELDALRVQGLLSDEEFAAKKAELLSRM